MIRIKSKTEIINETVEFYGADPINRRSVRGQYCAYNGPDDKHCAFARCIQPGYRHLLIEGSSVHNCVKNVNSLFSYLEPKYRVCDLGFWSDLQKLHDLQLHWSDTGLSDAGKREYKYLLNKYKEKEDE